MEDELREDILLQTLKALFSCDYYDWEKNEPYAIRAFRGEYMSQYSWAEVTLAGLVEY